MASNGTTDYPELTAEHIAAETRKWVVEERKLGAEREKLFQAALKLERERWWCVPAAIIGSSAVAALIGAAIAVVARHW